MKLFFYQKENKKEFAQKNFMFDLIVVGAGAAGLAAALSFTSAGKRVLVLEKRPRIGGRVLTTVIQGNPIELGAEFLHSDTSISAATQLGLNALPQRKSPFLQQKNNGKLVDGSKTMMKVATFMKESHKTKATKTATLLTLLKESLPSLLKEESFMKLIASSAGEEPEDISSGHVTEGVRKLGGPRVVEGMSSILERISDLVLSKGGTILLGKDVKRVECEEVCKVMLSDNTFFSSRYVLIATPFTVLDKKSITFSPPLKRKFSTYLNAGSVTKCVLIFDSFEAFGYGEWGNIATKTRLQLIWKPTQERESPIPAISALIGGNDSRLLDRMTKEKAIDMLLGDLEYVLQKEMKSHLVDYELARWGSDGIGDIGYSSWKNGTTREDIERLKRPHCRKIFFAGEHLLPEMSSTVHGALMSGYETASTILEY